MGDRQADRALAARLIGACLSVPACSRWSSQPDEPTRDTLIAQRASRVHQAPVNCGRSRVIEDAPARVKLGFGGDFRAGRSRSRPHHEAVPSACPNHNAAVEHGRSLTGRTVRARRSADDRSFQRDRLVRLCKAVLTDPNLTPTTPHSEHEEARHTLAGWVRQHGTWAHAGSYGSGGWRPVHLVGPGFPVDGSVRVLSVPTVRRWSSRGARSPRER
jgi:hypothetical protein